jgi:hypothetical protein
VRANGMDDLLHRDIIGVSSCQNDLAFLILSNGHVIMTME